MDLKRQNQPYQASVFTMPNWFSNLTIVYLSRRHSNSGLHKSYKSVSIVTSDRPVRAQRLTGATTKLQYRPPPRDFPPQATHKSSSTHSTQQPVKINTLVNNPRCIQLIGDSLPQVPPTVMTSPNGVTRAALAITAGAETRYCLQAPHCTSEKVDQFSPNLLQRLEVTCSFYRCTEHRQCDMSRRMQASTRDKAARYKKGLPQSAVSAQRTLKHLNVKTLI